MACGSARSTMKANSATSARQSTMPNSSAATANTKSAWLSGRMRLTVPSPGPRPNQPPRMKDSIALSTWKVSPEAGSMKRLMRARDVRDEEVGAGKPDRGRAAEPATQIIRMPAMKNSAPQTSAISMVWPKSGCSTSTAIDRRAAARARTCSPACRACAPIRANSQAIRITKAGLRNSDGWMLTPSEHDPAPRALDLGADRPASRRPARG